MGKLKEHSQKPANKENKGVSAIRFRSVGLKLFALIFCSIIACVIAVGMLAYTSAKSIIENKVSEASLQTVNQLSANLNDHMSTFEDISMQMLIDKDFHTSTSTILTSEDDFTKYEAQRKLTDKLQTYIMGSDDITGIMLLPLEKGLSTIVVGNASISKSETAIASGWYEEAVEANGKVVWIRSQKDGIISSASSPSLALSRVMKNPNSSASSFLFVMEIKLSSLTSRYEGVNLGEGSNIVIIDPDGNYITTQDSSQIGEPAHVILSQDSNINRTITNGGEEVLAVHSALKAGNWQLAATIPVNELVKDAEQIWMFTWGMVLCAAVIAIAIGALVIFTIGRPLVQLQKLMNEGAQGNLTVRSNIKKSRKDEIGQLGGSFNEMMSQIASLAIQTTQSAAEVLKTAGELTESSRKTAISAREISVATEEIANGATSLAVEAEKGSDLSVNINARMSNVNDANKQMVQSAVEVQQASGEGTKYMGTLIEKTGLTEEMTRSMVQKVDALKESTGSIVKILDVLNNLTKQTNILSLNATIEAARAGAAGKGFMVVADEIRKLADQSRQSIDIVGQITEKIQLEIEETVSVLSDAYPIFQQQIGSVKEANQIFLTVQGQMEQFVESLDDVTQSIGELDQSQAVLTEAMTNVSAVAQQSSATSEEVASLSSEQLSISDNLVKLSERLDSVSQELKSSLSRFKIE